MKTDFTITMLVSQTPKEVYDAVNNVRGWWSEELEGTSDTLNGEFIYRHKKLHYSKQRVTELIPGKKVVWLVTDSKLSFAKHKSEWTGTKIVFDISKKGSKTELRFTHAGLVPEFDCYEACSGGWTYYVNGSLRKLITTGKGQPDQIENKKKATSDFTTTLSVNQTPKEVFNAITNVRGWWSREIEGNTEKQGDEFTHQYKDIHYCQIKIIKVVPNKKVVWLVKYNYFKFTKDKSEWTGTKIIFDISKKDNTTQIRFTHQGLVPEYECYDICQNAWTDYIQQSLRSLITTGKGKPHKEERKKVVSKKK